NLPHYKAKLNDIAKELYLEHGWQLPKGFIDRNTRDPLSFNIAEWQQAKRAKQDPRLIKAVFQECWQGSDNAEAFRTALRGRGYWLAKGDRRGYVALDHRGEVYSLSRMTGTKTKELKDRLGDPAKLPSVEDTKAWIAERLSQRLKGFVAEREAKHQTQRRVLEERRARMVQRHRLARSDLKTRQDERWKVETKERADRLPKGVKGLWSWVTGRTRKIRIQNEAETALSQDRDRNEKQAIIRDQLSDRRKLQKQIVVMKTKHNTQTAELNRDVAHAMMMGGKAPMEVTKVFDRGDEAVSKRSIGNRRERGPDFDL
ncbi:MAG: relaxase, partial [Pseudomonadota bacterium]